MNLKLKRSIIILSVNMIIVGLGVVISELIFGNWIHSNNLTKLNMVRSQTIKYNIEDLYGSSSPEINYTRDEYGLRGSFKDPSEIDILTVGGSTTDQRNIMDGETWQDVIQEQFKQIGEEFVVANAGIDGQSTFGHIKNFDWWFPEIPNLKPKYILFYVGINDFYKDEGAGNDALISTKETWSVRQTLSEKSAIFNLLRTLKGIYKAQLEQSVGLAHRSVDHSKVGWINNAMLSSYGDLMKTRLNEYAERLNILIDKTRDVGSIPIFVTQPSRTYRKKDGVIEGSRWTIRYDNTKINGLDFYYMIRKLDKVTISVCQARRVVCIDMAEDTVWEDNDFYDRWHMTPKGTKRVGFYLFEQLKKIVATEERGVVAKVGSFLND